MGRLCVLKCLAVLLGRLAVKFAESACKSARVRKAVVEGNLQN